MEAGADSAVSQHRLRGKQAECGECMKKINPNSVVDLFLQVNWKSAMAKHTDCFESHAVNVWRDILPAELLDSLMDRESGDAVVLRLNAGDVVPAFAPQKLIQVRRNQIRKRLMDAGLLTPQIGRFYPKGLLKDVTGIFSENVEPFRLVAANNGHFTANLNHPMADKEMTLKATIGDIDQKQVERGGTSVDWMGLLLEGPGMQARWMDTQTDFFSGSPFAREDVQSDTQFYRQPRFVQHLDDTAIEMVTSTYGRFLKDGMKVLDLMSSWQSHLPSGFQPAEVMGLGLNEAELKKNKRLTDIRVQDLNTDPMLPFEPDRYDVALCTVSVEYLTDPMAVFSQVADVLRPDGYFVVTFSNRWFPTKAVRIWKEIHEFERMGLVLEYFIRSGRFKDLQTYSVRGLPRPRHDKYFPEIRMSDPVFAVWGQKK